MCAYSIPVVSVFDENMYPNGVRIYKPLTNKTAPRVALDAIDPVVVFGTGVAYDGTGGSERSFLDWKLNDGLGGRLTSGGPVASVIPRFSDVNDDDHHLKVQLTVFPTLPEPMDLVAYLLLLGNKSRCMHESNFEYIYHSHRPTCHRQSSV